MDGLIKRTRSISNELGSKNGYTEEYTKRRTAC